MPKTDRAGLDQRALILAPIGKDGVLAASALQSAGIVAVVCRTMDDMARECQAGAGALIVAQEAVTKSQLPVFQRLLTTQPPWSDIPIAFLCTAGDTYEASRRIVELLQPAGNFTLLERPVQKLTLISVVQMALRARRRQYQVRDLLHQLEESQAKLHEKVRDLEQFEQAVVGRELKMITLEKENRDLRDALQQPKPAPRRAAI